MTNSAVATGPITEAGKAISSRNAVKHNLTSTRLTGSDLDELNVLRAKLDAEWQPTNETESALVHQLAFSQWRMERSVTLELQAFNEDHLDAKLLSLSLRYRNSAERAFYKALKELQRLRKEAPIDTKQFVSQERESLTPDPCSLAPGAHGAPNLSAAGEPQFVSQSGLPVHTTPSQSAEISRRRRRRDRRKAR